MHQDRADIFQAILESQLQIELSRLKAIRQLESMITGTDVGVRMFVLTTRASIDEIERQLKRL